MAILSDIQLSRMRAALAALMPEGELDYLKEDASAGFQALEDYFANAQTLGGIRDQVESSVPGVFTNDQKNLIISVWLELQ